MSSTCCRSRSIFSSRSFFLLLPSYLQTILPGNTEIPIDCLIEKKTNNDAATQLQLVNLKQTVKCVGLFEEEWRTWESSWSNINHHFLISNIQIETERFWPFEEQEDEWRLELEERTRNREKLSFVFFYSYSCRTIKLIILNKFKRSEY